VSFTYDLATDIGEIRLDLGDTVSGTGVKPDGTNLSDEEIQLLLTREDDIVGRAVAAACEVLARMYARFSDYSFGPKRESMAQSEQYAKRAAELRVQYGGGGGANRKAVAGGIIKVDGYNAGLDYATDAVSLSGRSEYASIAQYLD